MEGVGGQWWGGRKEKTRQAGVKHVISCESAGHLETNSKCKKNALCTRTNTEVVRDHTGGDAEGDRRSSPVNANWSC